MLEVFRRLTVDRIDLDEGEIPLVIFGGTHFTFNRVARVQVKAADLRGRDVNVVGAGQVARIRTS